MYKPRVLFTSVGGLVVPNMIKSLREAFHNNIYIIGVDINSNAVGFHFTDKNYIVSKGNENGYTEKLLSISKKESIDVILPLSDEELLALAKDKSKFEREGIQVACSEYNIVKTAMDKAFMLQYLEKEGLPCPEYRIPSNLKELERDIKSLGYPNKKVVFKPRKSRGARGFWILNANLHKRRMILEDRDRQEITLEWLLESLKDNNKFPDILAMEYLPGDDFNVDVLSWKGKPIYTIPNERMLPKHGPVRVGHIRKNKKVETLVKQVVESFKFDYYVNVEVAYRSGTKANPFVYEINPRISAAVVANKAAGIDILTMGVKLALKKDFSKNINFKETQMIRYWNELFF
ncbi:MAG: ATP-grasp domain-containing protein [bacterium]|nr:ATP-grasp domain-containing protein [bacterium]